MANKDIQIRPDRQTGLSSFDSMSRNLDQMFQHFLSDPFGSWLRDFPTVSRNSLGSIKETDQAYLLAADIPGIPKEDVKIQLDGNVLRISAQNDRREGDENGPSYRREYQSFQQSFTLPSNVDAEKIEAHCENGVLEVLIPKTAQSKARQIDVQSGKGGFANRLKSEDKDQKKNH